MKEKVISRLMELPEEIKNTEIRVIELHDKLQEAKEDLEELKADILLGRVEDVVINGKNAEIRDAQLRQYTAVRRTAVEIAERVLADVKILLNNKNNEFKAMRAIARMLGDE